MKYKVKIEPEALADIQDISNWYNKKKSGLGKKFRNSTIKQINSLKKRSSYFCYPLQGNSLYGHT
jgi:hypothetical protein